MISWLAMQSAECQVRCLWGAAGRLLPVASSKRTTQSHTPNVPYAPPKNCHYVGCGNLTTSGPYCPKHTRPRPEGRQERKPDTRPSASKRGYDRWWRKLRLEVLHDDPFCRSCRKRGLVEQAVEVDHIVPLSRGGARLAKSNLQPLCRACHHLKTSREQAEGRFPRG